LHFLGLVESVRGELFGLPVPQNVGPCIRILDANRDVAHVGDQCKALPLRWHTRVLDIILAVIAGDYMCGPPAEPLELCDDGLLVRHERVQFVADAELAVHDGYGRNQTGQLVRVTTLEKQHCHVRRLAIVRVPTLHERVATWHATRIALVVGRDLEFECGESGSDQAPEEGTLETQESI